MILFATGDKVRRFLAEEDAASLVEYAVMLFAIVLGCVVLIKLIGGISNAGFEQLVDGFQSGRESPKK